METDDDHATLRENCSLVQNILLVGCTKVLPAHQQENMVEKLWETMQFGLFFLQRTLEGTPGILGFEASCWQLGIGLLVAFMRLTF